jgi:hypothetical protein
MKITSPRLVLQCTSNRLFLETSVSRVDLLTRSVGSEVYRFTLAIQQNHVGSHTVTGWPSNVTFNQESFELASEPGAITIVDFTTLDWGNNWFAEVKQQGKDAAAATGGPDVGSGIPAGTEDNQTLVYNPTGGPTGWQPTKLKPGSLNFAPAEGNTIELFGYSTTGFNSLDLSAQRTGFSTTIQAKDPDDPNFMLTLSFPYTRIEGAYSKVYVQNDPAEPLVTLQADNVEGTVSSGVYVSTAEASIAMETPSEILGFSTALGQGYNYIWGGISLSTSTPGSSSNVRLACDQSNSLALVKSTTSQMLSVYQTSSSANANYRRLRSYWRSSSVAVIAAEAAGSLASSNVSIAISTLGTGYFSLRVPDGTAANGFARGANSIDLQTKLNNSGQGATGIESTVIGGSFNAAGDYGLVVGSTLSSAMDYGSVVASKSSAASGIANTHPSLAPGSGSLTSSGVYNSVNTSISRSSLAFGASGVQESGLGVYQNLYLYTDVPVTVYNVFRSAFANVVNSDNIPRLKVRNCQNVNLIGVKNVGRVVQSNNLCMVGTTGDFFGNGVKAFGHQQQLATDIGVYRGEFDSLLTADSIAIRFTNVVDIKGQIIVQPLDDFDEPLGSPTVSGVTRTFIADGNDSLVLHSAIDSGPAISTIATLSMIKTTEVLATDMDLNGNNSGTENVAGMKLRITLIDPAIIAEVRFVGFIIGYAHWQ